MACASASGPDTSLAWPSPDLVSTCLRRCVAAGVQRRCNAPAQAGRDGIPNTKGSFIMAIDSDKLNEFLGKFVGDLGATAAAGSVVIGHNLGLYKALADAPATAEQLAA